MPNFSEITLLDLKNGKYKELFPDLYNLSGLTETNPWHKHQVIFDHILAVFKALKANLLKPPLYLDKLPLFTSRMSQKLDQLTREEMLILTVLFHDCGKRLVLIEKDGQTKAAGHEIASAYLFSRQETIPLSEKDREAVTRMISLHGFINEIAFIYEETGKEEILQTFSRISGGFGPEMTLFMLSDMEGSDAKELMPKMYDKHHETLVKMLNYYL